MSGRLSGRPQGYATQRLQILAGAVFVVLLQKSHHASPSRPVAQSRQIQAMDVFVVFLQ